jgi:hypothetical protein
VEKSSQTVGYFRNFQNTCPIITNRPLGENSPNLVTLPHSHKFGGMASGEKSEEGLGIITNFWPGGVA